MVVPVKNTYDFIAVGSGTAGNMVVGRRVESLKSRNSSDRSGNWVRWQVIFAIFATCKWITNTTVTLTKSLKLLTQPVTTKPLSSRNRTMSVLKNQTRVARPWVVVAVNYFTWMRGSKPSFDGDPCIRSFIANAISSSGSGDTPKGKHERSATIPSRR